MAEKLEKKNRRIADLILMVLILLCILLAFVPRSSRLQVLVPKSAQTYGTNEKVLSVEGNFDGETREGKSARTDSGLPCVEINLDVQSDNDNNHLVIQSESDTITAFYYWGIQFLEYYQDSFLAAYSTKEFSHPDNPYFRDMTLPEAIHDYCSQGYLLILSAKGDARTGWSQEMNDALLETGIETTPKDEPKGGSYLAWVWNDDSFSYAGEANDTEYEVFNNHRIYMTSAGASSGNRSSVLIDGKNCSPNGNGINLIVYDPENGKLIDSLSYNTNVSEDKVVMSRKDDLFYTIWTITVSDTFLEQVAVRAGIAKKAWRFIYLAMAALSALILLDFRSIRHSYEKDAVPHGIRLVLKQFPAILLYVITALIIVGWIYLINNFPEVTIDQLLFHMNTNLDGANWNNFSRLFHQLAYWGGAAFILGLVLLLLYMHLRKKPRNADGRKAWKHRLMSIFTLRWSTVLACIVAVSVVVDSFWWQYGMYDYLTNTNFDAEIFEDAYADPEILNITFPEEKKNLIYIFMESMEMSSADESVGGGKSANLIPELTELALSNDCFNGNDGMLNGGIPLTGGTWTIAGIVSQTAGLPLELTNAYTNKRGTMKEFMPGAYNLGDILEQEGYNNVFMLGSDAAFGNRKQYFQEHGGYEIDDYYWARRTSRIPYDYFVWWGYEDKKLFSYAQEEASKLAEEGRPFNLTLLTVDTHFTNGWKCEDCPDTFSDQYSNVINCSSRKAAEFVQWVQQQPWGKDTVIVLSGDHLCMDDRFFSDMPAGYQRKTFVTVINSRKEQPAQRRTYATIDLFPTTLSALGAEIPGDRLGLGTDLYSDTPTLIEEKGKDYLNAQFAMNSDFYKKKILYGEAEDPEPMAAP